jgi:hypothetical protein
VAARLREPLWVAQTNAAHGPIPPAKKDDSEDVAWALSTAEAMYARGDQSDALKWLRRAAEAASEEENDERALELAKAAADLASSIGPPSMPPPPPSRPVPSTPPSSRPASVAPSASSPTPAAPPSSRPALAGGTPPTPARASVVPTPVVALPPTTPGAPVAALPRVAPLTVDPAATAQGVIPAASRAPSRRGGRRSRPDIQIARPPDEPTALTAVAPTPRAPPAARRGRRSRPALEEVEPFPPRIVPDAPPTRTDEIDAWPTQSTVGEQVVDPDEPLDDPADEKTRIGVAAYEYAARVSADAPSTPAMVVEASIPVSQAVRVVVWRTADGVRIAPQGTVVAAITVEAVLVALDPMADLAAWLSGK